jgi:hypothetical protein
VRLAKSFFLMESDMAKKAKKAKKKKAKKK